VARPLRVLRAAECTIDLHGSSHGSAAARSALPLGLTRYAQAFLETAHDNVRFLWREHETAWLAVTFTRENVADGRLASALVGWSSVSLPHSLTAREIDVLTLVCLGLTNQQIADRLGTSARTVSTQIERLLPKLSQHGRAGLAAVAVDSGLLRLPIPGGVTGETGLALLDVERASTTERVASDSAPAASKMRRPVLRRAPFQIGSVLLAGASSADGVEARRGAELAVAQINARGGIDGRMVEHVVASADFFNPAAVTKAFRSLIDLDVDAIITSYANAECPEVLDLVADFGQPFLHNATFEAQVERVREDQSRFGMVFQTCPSEIHYGVGLIRLLDELSISELWQPTSRRIVALELEAASTHTANESFFAAADRSGWDVADVAQVPLVNPDWAALISRVTAHSPAAVMVNHFVPEALVDFQRAFRASGNDALVYGVYGPSIPHFTETAKEAAEGMIWSTVTGTYDDTFGRTFRRDFETLHGTPAGWSQAGAAFDQVKLMAAAWASTGTSAPSEVLTYLRSTVFRGVNGVYYLGAPGQSALSYPDVTPDPSLGQAHMVFQVQNGESRVLGPSPYGDITAFRTPPWFSKTSA